MNVLVDTSVWSLALRRKQPSDHVAARHLRKIIEEDSALLLGVVAQELLSSVRHDEQFTRITAELMKFKVIEPKFGEYVAAATIANGCTIRGISITTVDALIAAISIDRALPLLTTDRDFQQIAKVFPELDLILDDFQ